VGYARDRGPVHVNIADRVWGGADGAYNRSLSRIVTNSRDSPRDGHLAPQTVRESQQQANTDLAAEPTPVSRLGG
jgi:hypothetical protein